MVGIYTQSVNLSMVEIVTAVADGAHDGQSGSSNRGLPKIKGMIASEKQLSVVWLKTYREGELSLEYPREQLYSRQQVYPRGYSSTTVLVYVSR